MAIGIDKRNTFKYNDNIVGSVVGLWQNDAADITADTSVDSGNTEPPVQPLDSALKNGLDTML